MFRLLICCNIIMIWFLSYGAVNSAEYQHISKYQIIEDSGIDLIQKLDWELETKSIVDTVDLSDAKFSRGFDWEIYDPIYERIYFQEALTGLPSKAHYYELSTKQLVDLPYDNYGSFDLILSPGSKYLIIKYNFVPYEKPLTQDQYKTIVLDGQSLSVIGERIGLSIKSDIYGSKRSFVSFNNKYLFNAEYLPMQGGNKETAVVTYSLPDLIPVDTLYIYNLGWEGKKSVRDVSQNSILIYGIKKDSTNNIPPGRYVFTLDGESGDLTSEIIQIVDSEKSHILLTPESDEIISIESNTGLLRRYSLSDSEQLGEINGPEDCYGPVFRDDGYLYIFDVNSLSDVVIDYKNNSILRTFEFNE